MLRLFLFTYTQTDRKFVQKTRFRYQRESKLNFFVQDDKSVPCIIEQVKNDFKKSRIKVNE